MTSRKSIILGFVLLAAIGGAVWFLFHQEVNSDRPIQEFHITSELKQLSQKEVEKVLKPYLGESFWGVELDKIQADLMRLDWVNQAVVKRSWPNQLEISIEEQSPVARWGETGLLNYKGEVFFPNHIEDFEHFVRLDGKLENSKQLLLTLAELQKEFTKLDWSISRLQETANGVWEIHILNGPKLILDHQDEQHKLKRFVEAYPHLFDKFRKSAQVYDLRYSNGFAIKVKEASSSSSAVDKNSLIGKR